MMLWKAADARHPQVDARDIRRFGWDVKEGGFVTPSVSNAPVTPHGLLLCAATVAPSETCASSRGAAVIVLDFPVRNTATARGDTRCSPLNKHTEEDQLAEDMQVDERERVTMMNYL